MPVKIHPAEGYGAHIRSVEELADETQAVRVIAETAAGGGVEEAPIDSNAYLRSNGAWLLHQNLYSIENATIERLIDGSSVALTQYPTGTGDVNARQIEFGPGEGTGGDPVQLNSLGAVTFNTAGLYRIKVALQFGREGSGGVSHVLFRVLVNGTQAGRSVAYTLENSDSVNYFENDTWIFFPAGITLTFEVMRDAAGNNSGGLKGYTPSGSWNDAPSAAIRVERLVDP